MRQTNRNERLIILEPTVIGKVSAATCLTTKDGELSRVEVKIVTKTIEHARALLKLADETLAKEAE